MKEGTIALLNRRKFVSGLSDVLASKTEKLPIQECVGRISAQIKAACPPGYPVLIYGELILEEHLKIIPHNEKILVVARSSFVGAVPGEEVTSLSLTSRHNADQIGS